MARTIQDDEDRGWRVDVRPAADDTGGAEAALRFTPQGDETDALEIRAVGPLEDELPRLGRAELNLALEAASNDAGYLFLDRERRLWWVRTDSEDPLCEGCALTFVHASEELHHPGPLEHDPDELGEDELQELLDEAQGRVMG